jgi:hypothetical protein
VHYAKSARLRLGDKLRRKNSRCLTTRQEATSARRCSAERLRASNYDAESDFSSARRWQGREPNLDNFKFMLTKPLSITSVADVAAQISRANYHPCELTEGYLASVSNNSRASRRSRENSCAETRAELFETREIAFRQLDG